MKNACLILSLVVSAGLMYAPAARGQKDQTQNQGGAQTGTAPDAFLSKAMEMNQAEINLSRMAENKAMDQMVKDYAEMMVQDHTQALDKLRSAAGGSQNEPSLSKEHQQMSDKLARLSGAQFDRAYMDAMVRDHQQAVQAFQREANNGGGSTRQKPGTNNQSDVDVARDLLPTLQEHLTQAEEIDKSVGGSATIK
jgi:putative membrane protein